MWKEITYKNIAKIVKLVDEFEVWELNKLPYGKLKIRIYEDNKGKFTGRTNLMVIDSKGSYYPGIGYGENTEQALNDTIEYFFSLVDAVENITENSFQYVDWADF